MNKKIFNVLFGFILILSFTSSIYAYNNFNLDLINSSEIKFTLQDVIYNACPKLYEELMEDKAIKDKINFSMDITEFLISVKKVF